MADTVSTVTTANDVLVNAAIEEAIIQEARDALVMGDKIALFSLSMEGPRAITVPAWQALTMVDYSTEGSNNDSAATTTDGVTITAALGTLDVEIADLLKGSAYGAFTAQTIAHMGRAAAQYFERKVAALNVGFSSVFGTTAVALSLANCRSAIATLQAANPMVTAPGTSFSGMYWTFHPTQVGQLREEAATSASAAFSQPSQAEILNGAIPVNGFVGNLYGIPCYQTTANISDGTDHHGALLVPGALGAAIKFLAKYEFYRSTATREDRHALTSFFGVAEIKDAWGVELISVD
jgi:hypothetical protein